MADSTLERTCERWMLFNDPPTHTRLRRLVNAAFKPAVVHALRARVVAIAFQVRGSSASSAAPARKRCHRLYGSARIHE